MLNTRNTSMCAGCGEYWLDEELDEVQKLSMRVEAGGTMPSGQCPLEDCGALCFPDAAPYAGNKVYVVIESVEHEHVAVHVLRRSGTAQLLFERLITEQGVPLPEFTGDDLKHEAEGTLRMAGDDAWAVYLLERDVEEALTDD